MKFATLANDTLDGHLLLVSRDQTRCLDAGAVAPSLLHALQHWDRVAPELRALYEKLNSDARSGQPFDPRACIAPLPRSPQWCDGSAFLNHANLMAQAFNTPPIPDLQTIPLMYQGASDDFLGPYADIPLPDVADGIDFEGEFGVIVDSMPMACTPEQALERVRLVLQLNDWSLRALGPREMRSGFGFLQAKPSTSFAPLAITPDELGDAWRDGRVQLNLAVEWNGEHFGHPHGGEMNFSFGQLIAHAARTRRLSAGTIIGTGTVSNVSRDAGSACIAERRVIEIIAHGEARTGFMQFGDRIRMEARWPDGASGPFGVIEQRVVKGGSA
ncbi:fumarylacetoacetate hydrolase family protein [Oxalobacteraceae bacterium]|nr:fumarylacetoacetate hydrolase family protein [Oxalobacteraceae bacterium]